MSIDFEYNDNACREVIAFYKRKIKELLEEIEKLETEKEKCSEPAVISAFDDYIKSVRGSISSLEQKIKSIEAKQQEK